MVSQVQIRSVYWNEMIYPINDTAKLLTELTGRKTLLKSDLAIAIKLWISIKFVAKEIKL